MLLIVLIIISLGLILQTHYVIRIGLEMLVILPLASQVLPGLKMITTTPFIKGLD